MASTAKAAEAAIEEVAGSARKKFEEALNKDWEFGESRGAPGE